VKEDSGIASLHNARLLLLSLEAVTEDKGMKQETFNGSKMWWSLKGDAEPRGDISDVPPALP
jgi:hypothetical protein